MYSEAVVKPNVAGGSRHWSCMSHLAQEVAASELEQSTRNTRYISVSLRLLFLDSSEEEGRRRDEEEERRERGEEVK